MRAFTDENMRCIASVETATVVNTGVAVSDYEITDIRSCLKLNPATRTSTDMRTHLNRLEHFWGSS